MAENPDNIIHVLNIRITQAETDLNRFLIQNCDGSHVLVQHRDRLPAWCRDCGRDALGNKVGAISSERAEGEE